MVSVNRTKDKTAEEASSSDDKSVSTGIKMSTSDDSATVVTNTDNMSVITQKDLTGFSAEQIKQLRKVIDASLVNMAVPAVKIHLTLNDEKVLVNHTVNSADALVNILLKAAAAKSKNGGFSRGTAGVPASQTPFQRSTGDLALPPTQPFGNTGDKGEMIEIMESILYDKKKTTADGDPGNGNELSNIAGEDGIVDKLQWKHKEITWRLSGFLETEPRYHRRYFEVLGQTAHERRLVERGRKERIVSICIPCFNEEAHELQRTLFSLRNQTLGGGLFRYEIVIVFDGVTNMSRSMSNYIYRLFGMKLNTENSGRAYKTGDSELDPFVQLPEAQTIVVEPADMVGASNRINWGGTSGGISLVIKRLNHRKANSHMWWFGGHAKDVGCELALATDCGTVFVPICMERMIKRLDNEPDLAAVTGFQRVMSSQMQGDGQWEIFKNPRGAALRMIQRFEFEADQAGHKPLYDTIGFLPVIPGPCGLYRYDQMGTTDHGVMQQYFAMVHREASTLILGNTQLAEDRIPSCLLVFRTRDLLKSTERPKWGWPKTGYVHDAVFFTECEKPLSQLVKQRRRWLNGAYAGYIWILKEHLITRAKHEWVTKICSLVLVFINVLQGFMIRMAGVAVVAVWTFTFGLVFPDLLEDPAAIFYSEKNFWELSHEPARRTAAWVCCGGYLALYVAFVVGHIPRAKPASSDLAVVRFTEATRWQSDHKSAYRPWLFIPSMIVNTIIMLLFLSSMVGTLVELGWTGTPFIVRVIFVAFFLPFIVAVIDGMVNQYPPNFSTSGGMIYGAPAYIPLMVWFSIWLPAYASARVSDLTWGNRENSVGEDESELALQRQATARKVAGMMITSNITITMIIIAAMHYDPRILMYFMLSYTCVLSVNYVITLFDQLFRGISRLFDLSIPGTTAFPDREAELNPDEFSYVSVDDYGTEKGVV